MVPHLKRKRPPISYREPSSSEIEDEEISETERRTQRLPQRRSLRSAARTSSRQRQRIVSYRESSSENESEEDYNSEDAIEETEQRKNGAAQTPDRSKRRRLQIVQVASPRRPLPTRPPRQSQRSSTAKSTPQKVERESKSQKIPSDGVKPEWSRLPYQVLLQIFVYASYPLQAASANWLLDIARMCRAFVEPALTALYRCPPLVHLDRSHLNKLVEGLLDPPPNRAYNYNNKIKFIELDVTQLPAYTPSHRGLFDLGELVGRTPQVTEIDLFDPADVPPYRRNRHSIRWHYPDSLFTSMEHTEIRLKSWRWNRTLFFKHQPTLWLKQIHETNPFKGVVSLTLSNFNEGELVQDNGADLTLRETLASALSVLSNLRDLTFESCTVLDGHFLALLEPQLYRLNITNCAEIGSDALQAFLITNGGVIKELTLNHNQALDLSFLPVIKVACPKLEMLCMDLNYYNTFSTHHDSDPKYEDLLKPEEVPSWPSSLQTLKLVYLRKWTSSAAETLFQSLIDSAEALPQLRVLVLKAILDISWRDRAQFRDRWIGRLTKTFLRPPTSPNPHLASLRAFREWKEQSEMMLNPDRAASVNEESENNTPPRNQSNDEDAEKPKGWHERRLRPRTRVADAVFNGAAVHGDSTSSDETSETRNGDVEKVKFIQGRCSIVDVSIDNLRPREELFNEGDFLDDEVSGDEDWDEDVGDVGIDESIYAW